MIPTKVATYSKTPMITYRIGVPYKTLTHTYKAIDVNRTETILATGCQSLLNWIGFRACRWP